MYARKFKHSRSQKWGLVFRWSDCSNKLSSNKIPNLQCLSMTNSLVGHQNYNGVVKKFPLDLTYIGFRRRYNPCCTFNKLRFYSSKGDGRNASGGKHVPVKDVSDFDKEKVLPVQDKLTADAKRCEEHAWLGEHDQKEWLKNEKSSFESKKRESPFLSKRQRFKNEFLRRVIPWEKMTVSWETFPYYIQEHTKNLLVECAASHLKHEKFASCYGSRLSSSSGRILLQSIPGTELYRERLVRALAHDLQVPLLILDSSVLAPHDFGQECESETEEDNGESVEESTSESEAEDENDASNEEDWASSSEVKSDSSDEDVIDLQASAEALKKLVPHGLEEFAKRISGETETASTSVKSDTDDSPQQSKRPFRKGDRVKYVGNSVHLEVHNRPLSSGQRGEVYEVNGDQVAVVLDPAGKAEEGKKVTDEAEGPAIYWIDIKDIEHDLDTQAEDWFIAMDALCEVLPSLQPVIVYFPDSSQWLSRAVPKSKHKEFIFKVEEMLDQLSGPVVLICGQNKVETGSKEKEKLTMVLPHFGRIGKLPLPLKQLTEGLKATKTSKDINLYKLFTNVLCILPPKEEELLRTFNKQIEEDRRIVIARSNLIELHKVLEEHDLICLELLHVKTDGVILTRQMDSASGIN